jgi:hypothetical protein
MHNISGVGSTHLLVTGSHYAKYIFSLLFLFFILMEMTGPEPETTRDAL